MFKLILLVAIVGCVVSTPTTKSSNNVRIVGGEDIDITEAPYQASVMARGRHICGGSILNDEVIVTAAHCITGYRPEDIQVRVGSSSNKDGGEVHDVYSLRWHPLFTYNKMSNDVGLIVLKGLLNFNDKIAPIEMIDEDEDIEEGDDTVVTGWGNLSETGGYPATLQRVVVQKVSYEVCKEAYAPSYKVTKKMLCAAVPGGGKDACQGDSGGPLVHNGKLAGVVSWGYGCARPQYPGVYAKVAALRDWLDHYLNNYSTRRLLRDENENFNMEDI